MRRVTPALRGVGHDRGRVEQPGLDRVSEIDGRDASHGPLDGMEVEEIALDHFGAEGAQAIRAFVDLVNEGANRNPACEQQFGYMPTGLALLASGGPSDEH